MAVNNVRLVVVKTIMETVSDIINIKQTALSEVGYFV